MPVYRTDYLTIEGKSGKADLEGANEQEVIDRLRDEAGAYPLRVVPAPKGSVAVGYETINPERFASQERMNTLTRLREALIDGDDAAYDQLVDHVERSIAELKEHPPSVPSAVMDLPGLIHVHEFLTEYPSAAAARRGFQEVKERQADVRRKILAGDLRGIDEEAILLLAAGTTGVGAMLRRGRLVLASDVALVFIEEGGARTTVVCPVPEFEDAQLKGWFRKRLTIRTTRRETWQMTLDPAASKDQLVLNKKGLIKFKYMMRMFRGPK